jgi:arylformamidase
MKLYRDFASQEEIDRQYNPMLTVPEAPKLTAAWTERSGAVRDRLEGRLGVPFGPTREEYLDIFPAGRGAPIHLFIHGGYWRRFSARDFSFVAEPLVAAGTTAVIANYALCPKVSMGEIVRQVRSAIAWTWRNAASFGGDPDRLTVSGHSAGGHLTAMALTTDWLGDYDLPRDLIKAALPISGLFDLSPFPYSWLQPAIQLEWREVRDLSPVRLAPTARVPLTIAVGGAESDEFRRQSRTLEERWGGEGSAVRYLEVPSANHFTVLDELVGQPGSLAAVLS